MATTLWLPVAIAVAIVVITYSRQLYFEIFPFHLLTAHKHSKPQVVTKSFAGRTVLVTGAHGAYGSRAAKLFKDADTLILVRNGIVRRIGPGDGSYLSLSLAYAFPS